MEKKNDLELQYHAAKFLTFFVILLYMTVFAKFAEPLMLALFIVFTFLAALFTVGKYIRFRGTKLYRLYHSNNRMLAYDLWLYYEGKPGNKIAGNGKKGSYILHEEEGVKTVYYIPFRRIKNKNILKITRCEEDISAISGQYDADYEVMVTDKVTNFWLRFYKWVHPDSRIEFWDRKVVCREVFDNMERTNDKEEKRK